VEREMRGVGCMVRFRMETWTLVWVGEGEVEDREEEEKEEGGSKCALWMKCIRRRMISSQ
jgi:hypothetical protein